MSGSGRSTFCFLASVVLTLGWLQSATAQRAHTPDLNGGEGGWVHARGARFAPVPGSASPVRQDPAHPFTPGQGRSYQIGDLSNPNLKPWVKELMKKDTAEIDAGKIAFQPEAACLPTSIPIMYALPSPLQIVQTPRGSGHVQGRRIGYPAHLSRRAAFAESETILVRRIRRAL